MLDGVVALNEVVNLARASKNGCLVLMVDFHNEYDYVSWSFLDYIKNIFGFYER